MPTSPTDVTIPLSNILNLLQNKPQAQFPCILTDIWEIKILADEDLRTVIYEWNCNCTSI